MEVARFNPEAPTVDEVGFDVVRGETRTTVPPRLLYLPVVKRSIDIVGASMLLILLSPVFLVVILLIYWDSPGNGFFRQTRLGKHCRPFTCYKFRSMVADAEELLIRDQHLYTEYSLHWKLVSDPRVTRIGRLMRKTSIDELPQLVNVLKGETSLVGPRPYMPSELAEEFGPYSATVPSVSRG